MKPTLTVLTVDDSRTMRELLMSALTDAGFDILQAVDGLDGLKVLETSAPDVIITDITMPRMDGIDFIKEVRADARRRSIPILVLTTETELSLKDRAQEAGATGWIAKPFHPEKLSEAIRRVAA